MIISRNEPLDYKMVLENIVNGTCDYLVKNKIKTCILGCSGGIDSTLTAAICRLVRDRIGVPLIGISLPCSTNKGDEVSSAALAGKEFCDEFSEVNIQDGFECIESLCVKTSGKNSTPISQGNIKARLRMIVLYDIASKRRGIVIDTDNTTEHSIGFFTVNGDVGDLNPIGNLWKTEVYGLARYLHDNVFKDSEALKAAIEITPTDGNGVSNSDVDQIMPGYTYDDVDSILIHWMTLDDRIKKSYLKDGFNQRGTVFAKLVEKYGEDNVKRVIMRSVNSEYKRLPHPIPIDVFRGEIVKKYTIE